MRRPPPESLCDFGSSDERVQPEHFIYMQNQESEQMLEVLISGPAGLTRDSRSRVENGELERYWETNQAFLFIQSWSTGSADDASIMKTAG